MKETMRANQWTLPFASRAAAAAARFNNIVVGLAKEEEEEANAIDEAIPVTTPSIWVLRNGPVAGNVGG